MAVNSDTLPILAGIHQKCLFICLSTKNIFAENDNLESTAPFSKKIKRGEYCMISRCKATAKIVLTHSSKKSKIDGKQAIQLRIIYNRRPKYYTLPYSVY
jgi:hypothetical protein